MKKLGILMGILLLSVTTFAMDSAEFEKNLTVHKLKNGEAGKLSSTTWMPLSM